MRDLHEPDDQDSRNGQSFASRHVKVPNQPARGGPKNNLEHKACNLNYKPPPILGKSVSGKLQKGVSSTMLDELVVIHGILTSPLMAISRMSAAVERTQIQVRILTSRILRLSRVSLAMKRPTEILINPTDTTYSI